MEGWLTQKMSSPGCPTAECELCDDSGPVVKIVYNCGDGCCFDDPDVCLNCALENLKTEQSYFGKYQLTWSVDAEWDAYKENRREG